MKGRQWPVEARSTNGLGVTIGPELLEVHMLRMTLRIIWDRGLPQIPKALVESGRLEAVREDQRLRASAANGLFLG
jgi:hypothetical protein